MFFFEFFNQFKISDAEYNNRILFRCMRLLRYPLELLY